MQLFVNLPVKHLERSKEFFTGLGFRFFGASPDMASVVISEKTQVMLLTEPVFAQYVTKEVSDATKATESILVLGLESPAQVDELVDKALELGATSAGVRPDDGVRYQRGFADLDGHHWEALCLIQPAG
ncbi:hypothetical protein E1295_15360 [Nonomuraea mesophila]|uniref:VOC domain-containing protein n=1 Tax=Nonomuraea mesophila TaxID=2530382 RepID=A0A4R5FPC3_9ACTN|nr:VOC family protein [Nonomuraea mesophila]TDE54503.1 hypothetical protein E1295_15360 [Nonomuraea mesophila]